MSTKVKGKKECKFYVIIEVAIEFKIACIRNNVRMNEVIEKLMIDYINQQKEIPPE